MQWSADCYYEQGAIKVANLLGIKCIVGNLLGIIVPLIIAAATGMIIFAGAKIIMGGDNQKEYQAGMQTLLYAIIGLVGLGLSWVILQLIAQFTGASSILDFDIQINR